MTEQPGPSATTTPAQPESIGVVDPMRIPGADRARGAWLRLPVLGRAFVVLATIDVVVRALGLFGTQLFVDLGDPLSVITAFVPHDGLILLPAILIWRRPDAIEATPLVMRGAVLVALVELLNAPLRGLTSGNPIDPFALPTIVSIAATFLTAAGWATLAIGLRELNPAKPEQSTAGLANIVGGAIALAAIVNLAGVLLLPGADVGDPRWNALLQLDSAMSVLQTVAIAYLARIVVLGNGDVRRPSMARSTATVAVVLLAIGMLVTTAINLLALTQAAFAQSIGLGGGPIWMAIGLVTGPVAITALVVAFGLGLADASDGVASDRVASDTIAA
jgi:hypothetical protein